MKSKSTNNPVSAEEIRKYHAGELSSKAAHRLERMALEDPFLADAMEGFADPEALSYWNNKAGFRSKSSKQWGWYTGIVLMGLLVALAVWRFSFAKQEQKQNIEEERAQVLEDQNTIDKNEEEQGGKGEMTVLAVASNDSTIALITQQDGDQDEPVDDAFVLVENIRAKKEASQNSDDLDELNLGAEKMQKIELETVLNRLSKYKDDRAEQVRQKVEHSLGNEIYHVRTYKVADYRNLRKEVVSLEDLQKNTGLHPAFENTYVEEVNSNNEPSFQVQYTEYLDMALAEFAAKNYEESARMFALILDQFPGDANGRFYRAMCLYELRDFEGSLAQLRTEENDGVNVFRRESAFYAAMCLKQLGRKEEACEAFASIHEEKEFYAEKAMSEGLEMGCFN